MARDVFTIVRTRKRNARRVAIRDFIILSLFVFMIRYHICFNKDAEKTEWGRLSKFEKFGRLGDDVFRCVPIDFDYLSIKSEDNQYKHYTHAAHGMLFARNEMSWKFRGAVLMQFRCDGVYGFPGGMVDKKENPVDALNRKMVKETGLNLSQHIFAWDHHIQSYVHAKKQLVLHFFVMEITMEDLMKLEMKSLGAKEFGKEVFGIVQVPLFAIGDGLTGLSTFLSSQFSGNAAQELIQGLRHSNLFSSDELQIVISNSN